MQIAAKRVFINDSFRPIFSVVTKTFNDFGKGFCCFTQNCTATVIFKANKIGTMYVFCFYFCNNVWLMLLFCNNVSQMLYVFFY